MKCQMCNKAKAIVHVTDLSGGKKAERHLCFECAQKVGEAYPATVSLSTLSELISQVSGTPPGEGGAREVPDISCSVCGMSLAEFQKEGRFGCPNDYQVFRDHISPLLERVHDGTTHVGKVPKAAGVDVKTQTEVRALRARLKTAVDREEYEEAARLRDELAKLLGDKEASKS